MTKIEWAERSWNPVTGCGPISEGCENCYARRMSRRLAGRCGYPKDEPFKPVYHEDRVSLPLSWKKPKRIFVCSMGDIFHPDVMPWDIANILIDVPFLAPQHTFVFLTKRPERLVTLINEGVIHGEHIPNNVWLGVTAENQQRADERIPILLQIPAAVRFVSVEPMLGAVGLRKWLYCYVCANEGEHYNPVFEEIEDCPECEGNRPLIDWVICGGETGPGARPMHPDWARSLRDQCQTAGIPFFFKQWGEWWPGENGRLYNSKAINWSDGQPMVNTGKKKAGRLLDGQEWQQMPEVVGKP